MSATSNAVNYTSAATDTASTGSNPALEKMIREARQAHDWILIAPHGRMYVTSKPEELIRLLARHHPLLKGLP